MKELKSLKEVCSIARVTRRMVQSYEKDGLVSASDRNKYGYLRYGDSELERVKQIRLYQLFGFKLKEIKEIIDAPKELKSMAVKKQLVKLKEKLAELNSTIESAERLILSCENNKENGERT